MLLEEMKLKELLELLELIDLLKPKTESIKKYEGYKIVRTYSAGVFAGYIESRNGREIVMINARRLWVWSGAASLSQLAMEGTKNPGNCKFPCEVDRVEILEVIEILDCSEKAMKSIKSVPEWRN